jgi:hypothetical protein
MSSPWRLMLVLMLAVTVALSVAALPAAGQEGDGPPHPTASFLQPVPGEKCEVEDEYEASIYDMKVGAERYEGICKRMKFAVGPIVVKPGENDALLDPVAISKPWYDGYIVRFKPDLLEAATGKSPATDHMHLHHATWLNLYPSYGKGPFFAAGEEKTVATFPAGYGMAVGARDAWALLYMVHNDHSDSQVVWLTYEIDYIAKADAEEAGIVPVKPLWLDVQGSRIHPEAPATSANPVFNVQRGFGSIDRESGRRVCTWPKQNCARHDTYGQATPQQGQTKDSEGNRIRIDGADWTVTENMAGTIVALGGHLHFGGIRDEVSLVRKGKEKMIFISDALYWNHNPRKRAKDRIGGPPTSWDFSMTVNGAPHWKVKIKEGDTIRINAVTDSDIASWYEGMGIVVAYVATEDPHKPAGVDVFDDDVKLDRGYTKHALIPKGPWDVKNKWKPEPCTPKLTGKNKRLCLRGGPTHGPKDESGNHSGGCPKGGCSPLPDKDGRVATDIVSAAFSYGDADMGVIGSQGIPLLKKGEPARFWNYDTVARIWHTYTRCKAPCTGATDMDYPMADGGKGKRNDHMDFDSSEIGFGTMLEPASGQLPPNNKSLDQTARDAAYWEFTPTEEGTYTFFCRIHKSMRGAFKVVE